VLLLPLLSLRFLLLLLLLLICADCSFRARRGECSLRMAACAFSLVSLLNVSTVSDSFAILLRSRENLSFT
jgi:hypothetical protein